VKKLALKRSEPWQITSTCKSLWLKESQHEKIMHPFTDDSFFHAFFVHAQTDGDTDPYRWRQVKSWKGTFTFTSAAEDDVTGNILGTSV